MIDACFRYSWLSWDSAKELLPDDVELVEFENLISARDELLAFVQERLLSPAPSDLSNVLRWVINPQCLRPPSKRTLNKAAVHAHSCSSEVQQAVEWVKRFASCLTEMPTRRLPDHYLEQWLERLAKTDFPAILLWRNFALATRIFCVDERGTVRARKPERLHTLRQSVRVCASYLLASLGRLSPRGAWSGVGFAKGESANCEPISIAHSDECFYVAPDIAWFARHWSCVQISNIAPGVGPWNFLREAIGDNDDERQRILADLQARALKVAPVALSFFDVSEFLKESSNRLAATLPHSVWLRDPHSWWIDRGLAAEASLPSGFTATLRAAADAHLAFHKHVGTIGATTTPIHPYRRAPFVTRIGTTSPGRIVLMAEEQFDWIVRHGTEDDSEHAWVPAHMSQELGWVARGQKGTLSFLANDPNPRRVAERHAANLAYRPGYCRPLRGVMLAPPPNVLDNRLVRLPESEFDPRDLGDHEQGFFLSTLMIKETLPLFNLELTGPVYSEAPDILPLILGPTTTKVTYGEVDPNSQIWYLDCKWVASLKQLQSSMTLIHLYFLEIHESMGSPEWLDVVLGRKRSGFPVHSRLAWDCVFQQIKRTADPIAFSRRLGVPSRVLIQNAKNQELPTEWIARRRQ